MLQLHSSRGSPPSKTIWQTIRTFKLDVKLVALKKEENLLSKFLKMDPMHQVYRDFVVAESKAIMV
jgi:hypothetical protein